MIFINLAQESGYRWVKPIQEKNKIKTNTINNIHTRLVLQTYLCLLLVCRFSSLARQTMPPSTNTLGEYFQDWILNHDGLSQPILGGYLKLYFGKTARGFSVVPVFSVVEVFNMAWCCFLSRRFSVSQTRHLQKANIYIQRQLLVQLLEAVITVFQIHASRH